MRRPPRAAAGQRGVALVAVVWVVALLAVMGLDVLAIARQEDRMAQDLAVRARMAAAADAGLALGIHDLLAASGRPGRPPGHPEAPARELVFDGTRLLIRVEDEAGKIDLNEVQPALLGALFRALEVPGPAAELLAAAILDWRDEDDQPRPGGAEANEYRAAGLGVPPRDGGFRSVAELAHVMGMTPALLARAEPLLTVHGRRAEPDREVAPPAVQRVMAGAPRPPAGAGRAATPAELRDPPVIGRAYRITVLAERPGARRRLSAVVRITGDPADPYWIQEYR